MKTINLRTGIVINCYKRRLISHERISELLTQLDCEKKRVRVCRYTGIAQRTGH